MRKDIDLPKFPIRHMALQAQDQTKTKALRARLIVALDRLNRIGPVGASRQA
jgi:hypothetical protein